MDPDSSLTMAYSNVGRLLSVDNLGTPGAPRVVMTYSYDTNGNTTQVQDSLGGFTNYSYDALDRLSRVTQSGTGIQPKRVDMTYSAASLLTQVKRFSDLAGTLGVANTNYEYDCGGCAGRLTGIRHRNASNNSVIHDMTFVRDPMGNILSSADAEGAHSYGYDPLRRLTSATHPLNGLQPNEFYTYDAVGNRLTSHLSYFYTYSWESQGKGNRLLKDNQFDYDYDDEGNLARRTERGNGSYTEFAYDHRNRLTAAVQKSVLGLETSRVTYSFDALGRRQSDLRSGQKNWIAYDGFNPIIALVSTGTVTNRRLYGNSLDSILADDVGGAPRWFLSDQVGTVRDLFVSNSSFNHYIFDSFGRMLSQSNPTTNNSLLFAGREFDSLTGLGYFRTRTYLSSGMFTQEDRVGPFKYDYAGSNPLAFIDPLGLSFFEDLELNAIAIETGVRRLGRDVAMLVYRAALNPWVQACFASALNYLPTPPDFEGLISCKAISVWVYRDNITDLLNDLAALLVARL